MSESSPYAVPAGVFAVLMAFGLHCALIALLWRYNWRMICQFQLYSMMIQCLYVLWSDTAESLDLSPCTVIRVILLVMRTLKIYFLDNIETCNAVLTIVTIHPRDLF